MHYTCTCICILPYVCSFPTLTQAAIHVCFPWAYMYRVDLLSSFCKCWNQQIHVHVCVQLMSVCEGGPFAVLPGFQRSIEKLFNRAKHSTIRKQRSDSQPEETKYIRTRLPKRHNFVPVIADLLCTLQTWYLILLDASQSVHVCIHMCFTAKRITAKQKTECLILKLHLAPLSH